jgi:formamidopyrimidine-DNA glycosylase
MRGSGPVPELPDVVVYIERLAERLVGRRLERVRLATPFLLRTFDPPISETYGKELAGVRRIGKRIVFGFEGELFLVVHLMIAGRFRWQERGAKIPGKIGSCAFDFENASLILTEASTKKRASLHCVRGEGALVEFQRGGVEPLEVSLEEFRTALLSENRTLKRALTDPRLFSGIGNAYSDEILFAARLSPVQRSHQLDAPAIERLFESTRSTLELWLGRLREESREGFPEKVTAFREGMAVHGRYKKPCPVCATPVQRIRYADNEVNYCPRCQTGGKLLADRSLSRLLHGDWPKSLEELEERRSELAAAPAPPAKKRAKRG